MSDIKGLDPKMIAELMGNSRSRNVYGPKLMTFIESDEAAINPAEVWPVDFGQKKATALYQGFLNAAKSAELTDTVLVKQYDGGVYLLHKERAAVTIDAINPDVDVDVDTDTDADNGAEDNELEVGTITDLEAGE